MPDNIPADQNRLMPPGMAWPMFEDGTWALPGDELYLPRYDAIITIDKIAPCYDGCSIWDTDGVEHIFDSHLLHALHRP